jgi:hypothetical protein
MGDFTKTDIKACCGKKQTIIQLGFALDKSHIQAFVSNGFVISQSYIDKGILYIGDDNIFCLGPFGSNRIQVKCKSNNCIQSIEKLETILKSI